MIGPEQAYRMKTPINSSAGLEATITNTSTISNTAMKFTFPFQSTSLKILEFLINSLSSLVNSPCSGIIPSKCFSIKTKVLCNKFPRESAKSALDLSIILSSEKSPSPPEGMSLRRLYLNTSAP